MAEGGYSTNCVNLSPMITVNCGLTSMTDFDVGPPQTRPPFTIVCGWCRSRNYARFGRSGSLHPQPSAACGGTVCEIGSGGVRRTALETVALRSSLFQP